MTLKNVKPFGTEGRLGDPTKEIPAVDDVYPVVVFRGSDVKDLSVLDEPPAELKEQPVEKKVEPKVQPKDEQVKPKDDKTTTEDDDDEDEEKEREERRLKQQAAFEKKTQQSYRHNTFQNASVPDTDFDFESANAKFKDLKVNEEDEDPLQRPKDDETVEPAYDKKKSFFDNISNSATETRPQRPNFGNGGFNNGRPNFGNNNRSRYNGRGGRGRRGRGGSNDNSWRRDDEY